MASQKHILAHPELVEEFIQRVLELEGAWISDEATLGEFHLERSNDAIVAKVKEVYGVDIADIQSAPIWVIIERIAAAQSKQRSDL